MLFQAKITECERHLGYIRQEFSALQAAAHPNLAGLIQMFLDLTDQLLQQTADLRTKFGTYSPAQNPAFDTWKQLFSELSSLAQNVLLLRIQVLPSFLAVAPNDGFLSRVVEALLAEVNVPGLRPVALLHQDKWFAIAATPDFPRFYIPASILDDPAELPLLFHEFGHLFMRLWDPAFGQLIATVVNNTLLRKEREARGFTSPQMMKARAEAVSKWRPQAITEVEEVVCDIVGTLLGGPAFVMSLMVGLLASSSRPFLHQDPKYPPMDCRMRIGGLVLRHRNLDDARLDLLEDGWDRVRLTQKLHRPDTYDWLYDDTYLLDLIRVVENYLVQESVSLFHPGCGGMRELFDVGSSQQLSDDTAHHQWGTQAVLFLRSNYDAVNP